MTRRTTRLAAGCYLYCVGGRVFRLEEVRRSEGYPGEPQWNVSEVVNGCAGAPFDAAGTLREAKEWAEAAADVPQKKLV